MKHICLTGAQGTGKTSVREKIREVIDMRLTGSVVRSIITENSEFQNHINKNTTRENQTIIFNKYIELHKELSGIQYISDRCAIDALAYTLYLLEHEEHISNGFHLYYKQYEELKELIKSHDLVDVYYLPVEFEEVEDDGVRDADKQYQIDIDNNFKFIIKSLINDVPDYINIYEITGSIEEMAQKIINIHNKKQKEMSKKAILSLSGGLDSTMLLLKLLNEGYEVKAYSFDYGQKHKCELKKVKKNIKFLQEKGLPILTHQIIDLKDCFSESNSSLSSFSGVDIPHGHYADENMKSTVIENRNLIFSNIIFGKALSWSTASGEDVAVALGLHAGDHAIYPDCRPESRDAALETFRISNWGSEKVDYYTPFVNIDKGEVLMEGLAAMVEMGFSKAEIKKVLKNTHTCYDPNEKGEACGLCGSCTERLEAFEANDWVDPAKYFK